MIERTEKHLKLIDMKRNKFSSWQEWDKHPETEIWFNPSRVSVGVQVEAWRKKWGCDRQSAVTPCSGIQTHESNLSFNIIVVFEMSFKSIGFFVRRARAENSCLLILHHPTIVCGDKCNTAILDSWVVMHTALNVINHKASLTKENIILCQMGHTGSSSKIP